jgi:ABC-type multidrug transport system ATPase subunit/multidrug efflux pump subunit AcrB
LRGLAAAGIVVAGAFAAYRLPLRAGQESGFPELTVSLRSGATLDAGAIGRRWLIPIEKTVRSLGGVSGIAGEVTPGAAELRVRLSPDSDPEAKAARLANLLAALAPTLPADGAITVQAGSHTEGYLAAVVWLGETVPPATARAVADRLRDVPGVREVVRHGGAREVVRVALLPAAAASEEAVRRQVSALLRPPPIGSFERGSRRWRLGVTPPAASLAALPVQPARGGEPASDPAACLGCSPRESGGGALPLASLASIQLSRRPVDAQVHLHGRPGVALWVWRDAGASPLTLSHALSRALASPPAGVRPRLLRDEGEALRRLLARLALGLACAIVAAAVVALWLGGRRSLLAAIASPLLAAAGALVSLAVAGRPLDDRDLPAVALAVAAATLGGLLRSSGLRVVSLGLVAAAALLALPAAAALGGTLLPPRLVAPIAPFVLATLGGLAAQLALPPPPRRIVSRSGRRGAHGNLLPRTVRATLRDPATVLLAAAGAAFVLAVYCGPSLRPRPGAGGGDTADVTLEMAAPAGATLAATEMQVARIERALDADPDVRDHWSDCTAEKARLELRLTPEASQGAALERALARLHNSLPGRDALRISSRDRFQENGAGDLLDLAASLEERAATDTDATFYQAVLRAVDADALRDGFARLLAGLRAAKVQREKVPAEPGAPSVALDLVPRPTAAAELVTALAAALRTRSAPPAEEPLPGDREQTLAVFAPGAPEDSDRVPQRAALLDRPLETGSGVILPAALVTVRERLVPRRLVWQNGRFILPLRLDMEGAPPRSRVARRALFDRTLAGVSLPGGCDLERPALTAFAVRRGALRAALLVALLPLLWLAIATVRLGSPRAGLATLAPLVLGAAAAALVPALGGPAPDEGALFALAAALTAVFPLAVETAAAAQPGRRRDDGRGGAYRRLRSLGPGAATGAGFLGAALLLPTLGAGAGAASWSQPLRVAVAAGVAATVASLFVVPALLAKRAPQARRPETATGGSTPAADTPRAPSPAPTAPSSGAAGTAASAAPSTPTLAVHNLTKVYAGGHRALRRVSFELAPGIVGLLGPNGAGKTTLIRCLVGLLEPSRGRILDGGRPLARADLAEYRRRIGFLPQDFNAYPGLTGERFLEYWAAGRDLPAGRERREEIERLLVTVGLAEHGRRKVRDYSGGMRRRLGIAAALLGSPPILIVDEPTTGLDIESRVRFRDTLLATAGNRIVLLSTHIASDVEAIASRLLVLHRGGLLFDGPPAELVARARGRVCEALVEDAELRAFSHRYRVTSRVRVLGGIRVRAMARGSAGESPPGRAVEPSLEEAYLAAVEAAG